MLHGLRLRLRIELDDELLVDDRCDFFSRRDAGYCSGELVFVDRKPIGHRNDGGEFHILRGEAAAALFLLNSDGITGQARATGNRATASVHFDVSVANHLACSVAAVRETEAIDDAVEACFEKLKEDFARNATTATGDFKKAAELLL